MRSLIKKVVCHVKKKSAQIYSSLMIQTTRMQFAVSNNRGENYVDSAVKILIAVVLGGLLLAGLYALFGDVVMPTLETKIKEMFNYAG